MPRVAGALAPWVRAALVALLAASQAFASAREASAQQQGGVALEIVAQPPWRRAPNQPLRLRLRISNETSQDLTGLQVRLSVGDRIASRSALHDSYGDPESFFSESAYTPIENLSVGGGESASRLIDDPVATLDTLAGAQENGVYPLAVLLSDRLGRPLAEATTPLIYYPQRVDAQLNFVLVLPLSDRPARSPDGAFAADALTGRRPLEEAVAPGGWLRASVAALRRNDGTRLAVAPVPRLMDELDDMADGYLRTSAGGTERVPAGAPPAQQARALLEDLRGVIAGGHAQLLFVPYGAPDLPAVTRELDIEGNLSAHFRDGLEALTEALGPGIAGRPDQDWIFPPAGRLDAASLSALQDVLAADPTRLRLMLSPDSVQGAGGSNPAGCPRAQLSFTCPVRLDGDEPARALVADAAIQERFAELAAPGNTAVELQRLLAETAMIREELPGVSGRVVAAIAPASWHPSPGVVDHLVESLARAPWLNALTPREALGRADAVTRAPIDTAAPVHNEPPHDFYAGVARAYATVERFAKIGPRAPLLRRLRRNVLAAQGRAWWSEPSDIAGASQYASETSATIARQLGNITIGGRDEITLTSSRQPLPLVLFNGNSYPVHIELHLDAVQLEFGTSIPVEKELNPGNNPVTVDATARSSGSFPLAVCVTAPEGDCGDAIARQNVTIRSTQFNKIALGVTFGALAFLVLFYVVRAARRRGGSEQTRGPASA